MSFELSFLSYFVYVFQKLTNRASLIILELLWKIRKDYSFKSYMNEIIMLNDTQVV